MAGKIFFIVSCALLGFAFASEEVNKIADKCIAKLELNKGKIRKKKSSIK